MILFSMLLLLCSGSDLVGSGTERLSLSVHVLIAHCADEVFMCVYIPFMCTGWYWTAVGVPGHLRKSSCGGFRAQSGYSERAEVG